jgi:hypothetical protein
VLDSFLDEPTRLGLLDFITQPGWPTASASPPASKWERATADAAAKPATWGLRPEVLAAFAAQDMAAKLEVQSRLSKLCVRSFAGGGWGALHSFCRHRKLRASVSRLLSPCCCCCCCCRYPDMLIAHMPSGYIQAGLPGQHEQPHQPQPPGSSPQQGGGSTHQLEQQQQHLWTAASVDCSCFLANAAVAGDQFSWHVDADPQSFPVPTPWSEEFGLYCNRCVAQLLDACAHLSPDHRAFIVPVMPPAVVADITQRAWQAAVCVAAAVPGRRLASRERCRDTVSRQHDRHRCEQA